MTSRCAVLLAVEQAVNGLIELRVADEGQVVHSDDRAYALGIVQPYRKFIGQPMEEVDLLRTAARGHGEVAPEIAPCEGQCTMRRDEPHRAIGQQALVERGVTRRGREEQIAVLWAELRERVEHEAAVVPEAGSIVCNALGIEGDIHRLSEATRGIRDEDGCTTSPRWRYCSGRAVRRALLRQQHRQRRCTSSCSSRRGSPSCHAPCGRSD